MSKKIKSHSFNVALDDSNPAAPTLRPVAPGNLRWKIVREHDGLIKHGSRLGFIEWNEDGTVKAMHDKPAVGLSLILDYHFITYGWMTSTITEIISSDKIKTRNSVYTIHQVSSEESEIDNKE